MQSSVQTTGADTPVPQETRSPLRKMRSNHGFWLPLTSGTRNPVLSSQSLDPPEPLLVVRDEGHAQGDSVGGDQCIVGTDPFTLTLQAGSQSSVGVARRFPVPAFGIKQVHYFLARFLRLRGDALGVDIKPCTAHQAAPRSNGGCSGRTKVGSSGRSCRNSLNRSPSGSLGLGRVSTAPPGCVRS